MKILLFNRNEQYIATLKGVLSAKHTEELNGENVLEIETLDEIEKNQRLIYKDKYGYWHEFIVRGVEEERAEEGIIRRVFAEHSFYETWGDYIEDKRPYDVPANIALSVALEPTRWEVGIVDDLGINSTNFYHISAKEAVQKVAETWQGELRYRGRYVDLLARRGHDLGKRFTYTKDLISITKTVHRDDVITALYGYGKGEEITDDDGNATGGYGRRIDFSGINGGKAYVEDNDAKEIWGRLNPDGTRSHVFSKAEFDDCEDPLELLELTTAKLEELSKPLITYNATVVDLKAFGIEHEGVALGDTVGIIDREFKPELRLKARVIRIVRDLLKPENTDITLGNFIPSIVDKWIEQEKFISNFRGKQGVWDRARIIESDGTINAQYLNNLVAELNAKMNALGGYVYISDQGEGLITYDRPDPEEATMAIQLLGGSFRIANSKLPNGEWNWRTFGDGNGFVADAFIGGLLKGGKVHFDLTNGTLLIGNSIEDYRLFFDGNNLSIRLSHGKTIEESIDEIEIGGRNLLLSSNTAELSEIETGNDDSDIEVMGDEWGRNLLSYNPDNWEFGWIDHSTGVNSGNSSAHVRTKEDYKIYAEGNQEYMISGRQRIVVFQYNSEGEFILRDDIKESDLPKTIETNQSTSYFRVFLFTPGSWNVEDVRLHEFKIEKGIVATPWSPAPEDLIHGYSYTLSQPIQPDTWYTLSTDYTGDWQGLWIDDEYVGYLNEGKITFRSSDVITVDSDVVIKVLDMEAPLTWAKLEKGNKTTDWTPAPEDVDQNISDSQEYLIGQLNETEDRLENVIGLVGGESVASIKQQLEDAFRDEIETIERVLYGEEGDETESILSRLSELGSDTAAIYTNLGEQTALIETLTGKISIEGDSILIGDAQASKGIRVKPNEIAFLEGESKVAWITGGMLYIDAGVFLTRLKIGNHVFQSVDGNPDITIVGYEP